MGTNTPSKKGIMGQAGAFIKEIISDDIPDYLKNPKSENIQENQTITNMSETVIIPAQTKDIDSRYEEQILKAVRSADLPGPDFLEFSEAVKKLQQLNPSMSLDDVIRNTFTVLSANGLTKARIIETGDHYRQVLKSERDKFEQSILQGSQNKIDVPQAEIHEMKSHNHELEKQLHELQSQIEKNKRDIESKQNEIETAKQKLSNNKAKFNNTISKIENSMTELINHVQSLSL